MLRRFLIIDGLLMLTLLLASASPAARGIIPAAQNTPGINSAERVRGIELYKQRKFLEASKSLQNAVKENKADDDAWYYLGLALLPQPKKIKDAAKAFETAIKLRPNFATARAGLAYAFLLRNKLSDAIREARGALAIEPNLADAYYVIGVARLRAGDRTEALQNAETAIKLNPNLGPAYLLKSQALVSFIGDVLVLDKGAGAFEGLKLRYLQAADALERYLQLNPESERNLVWAEQLESLRFHSGSHTQAENEERVFPGSKVTTKARVLSKPEPSFTAEARNNQITGTVVLRAVFAADGTVKHLLIVNGLSNGLTEAAVNAARKIKFVPATIDGRPVSMFIQLEYNFNLY